MGKISDLWVKIGLKSEDFEKGLNKATSKTQSFSNQAGKAVGELVARFTSLTAAIAVVGRAVKEGIATIAQFERANSNLAAILGTSKKGMADLTEAAMNLGRYTEFTATQVTELQTELAKLGFTKSQIKDAEESVLKFASAVGTDLASAAAFTGATIRSFGLQAEDTSSLLDVMAASCSKSALDFSKLQVMLPIVGATADAFGMNVKQVTALLGALANKGIDASTAATSLRNIFLDASSASSKLAGATGMQLNTYKDVFEALKKLQEMGGNLEDIAGAGTARTATQIASLASSIDTITALEAEFDKAGGTLEQMYKTATDNSVGATKSLESAWEGLILQFRAADGPIQTLKQSLADLLNGVSDLISSDFWDSKFWNTWKEGMKGAADFVVEKFTPVLNLFKKIKAIFPGKSDAQAIAEAATGSITVLGENDPNFIGPVLKKASSSSASGSSSSASAAVQKKMLESLNMGIHFSDAFTEEGLAGSDKYFKNLEENAEKIRNKFLDARDASEALTYSLQDGLVGAFDELANVIAGVEGSDMASLANALLSPFADMAVSLGTMIMTSGTAIEALKTSLTGFFGGNSIAAGAALVGIGVAMKAGLAAMANGSSSAAGTTSSSETTSATGSSDNMEMTIRIEGKLKGSDIVLAGQRSSAAWAR